jgi:hypothetical protein
MFNILPDYYRTYALVSIKTFKLSHRKWGEKSMGQVIDLVYDAFVAIQMDGTLILDYDFIMSIFGDLQTELPEFNTYMMWYFEEKECNPIGSSSKAQRVLSVDKRTEIYSILKKSRTCKPMKCVQHWQPG